MGKIFKKGVKDMTAFTTFDQHNSFFENKHAQESSFMKYQIEGIEVEEKPIAFLNYEFNADDIEGDLEGVVLESEMLSDGSAEPVDEDKFSPDSERKIRLEEDEEEENDSLTYISEYNFIDHQLLNGASDASENDPVESSLEQREPSEQYGFSLHLLDSFENVFACSYCDYKSKVKSHMKRHVKRHTEGKRFECGQCAYKFADKWHLDRHVKARHTDGKSMSQSQSSSIINSYNNVNFDCTTTDSEVKSPLHSFPKEIKREPGNDDASLSMLLLGAEELYECTFCDYKSGVKSHLQRHLRRHTREKRFECPECDYKFADKWHLDRHVKARHTDEKLVKNLEKSAAEWSQKIFPLAFEPHFAAAEMFSDWERTSEGFAERRTEDKLYHCSFCVYRSASKWHLQRHMKNRHANKKNLFT